MTAYLFVVESDEKEGEGMACEEVDLLLVGCCSCYAPSESVADENTDEEPVKINTIHNS